MPRGGKRPGAGAPKGNFNALKHGRRSAQFAQLGALIAANPTTREAMLNFARRLDLKQESAIESAVELHARIIEEARKIARGEPSPLEHVLRPNKNPPSRAQERGLGEGTRIERSISRCRTSLNHTRPALRYLPPTSKPRRKKKSPRAQSDSQ